MPRYLSLQSIRNEYADIKLQKLRAMIHRGELKATKIGRQWFVSREELDRLFKAREYKPRTRTRLRTLRR